MSAAANVLGLLAGGCVLLTFSVRSLRALRSFAIASNLLFIAYASLAQLMPILILHGLLLPLNVLRLRQQCAADRAPTEASRRLPCLRRVAPRRSLRRSGGLRSAARRVCSVVTPLDAHRRTDQRRVQQR